MDYSETEDESSENEIITLKSKVNKAWVKNGRSKQDYINDNPEEIQKQLENFEQILPEEYPKMENGTFIRYITYAKDNRPQLRLGGFLIKNGAPDYWVLKTGKNNTKRYVSWSVPLTTPPGNKRPNVYYRRKGVLYSKEEKIRFGASVFEALESGRYTMVETGKFEGILGHELPGRSAQPLASKTTTKHSKRFELVDDDNDSDDGSPVSVPKLKARFHE